MTLPILAITSGEPAGIGPDICLDLAQAGLPCRCVVLGDKDLLRRRAALLGKQITLRDFNPHRPSENRLSDGLSLSFDCRMAYNPPTRNTLRKLWKKRCTTPCAAV